MPVVALAAGLLFATSGRTAQGTDLRAGEVTELSELIEPARTRSSPGRATSWPTSQAQVRAADRAGRDAGTAPSRPPRPPGRPGRAVRGAGAAHRARAWSSPSTTPPSRPDGSLPVDARPDDLVIHQSDVQAVVNAVWAAGADGVAIMDQRLIATSAVRCVGNTLLLQGRTYSPPFVVTAIVDAAAVRAQLAASPQVRGLPAGRGGLRADLRGARADRGHGCPPTMAPSTWSTPAAG